MIEDNLPRTYGVPKMAGMVNPTPKRNTHHTRKLRAKAVAIPKKLSMNKKMKKTGRRPILLFKSRNSQIKHTHNKQMKLNSIKTFIYQADR